MKRLLGILCLSATVCSAQNFSQDVNLFTGDFNYSIPLVTVSGPNGESFPISAGYSAGISVMQDGGDIGLGWGIGFGEIRRQLNGFPDDWSGVPVIKKEVELGITTFEVSNVYGPLYFRDFDESNPNSTMDLYQSRRRVGNNNPSFEFPNYDQFIVSAPGFSGVAEFKLNELASIAYKDVDRSTDSDISHDIKYYTEADNDQYTKASKNFTKKPELYLGGDGMPKVSTPYYSTNTTWTQKNAGWFKSPYYITDDYSGDINHSQNRIISENFVEYFTNEEINTSYSILKEKGFLDYRVVNGERRPSQEFDPKGIGAIRVTRSDGMVYHFSLPVYNHSEQVTSFNLDQNMQPTGENDQYTKSHQYATSWKLVAITGKTYQDTNGNGIADEGDSGYWIAINYQKWVENFEFRSPAYGYHQSFQRKTDPKMPNYFTNKNFQNKGTIISGSTQIFYPASISTSTEKAIFVYELRNDGHSIKDSNGKVIPKLRMTNLVLVNNDGSAGHTGSSNWNNNNQAFLLSAVSNTIFTSNDYSQNNALINNSLGSVIFNMDYSLAKNYYRNINSEITVVQNSKIPELYEVTGSPTQGSNYSSSGKLTLKGIEILSRSGVKEFPDYNFSYSNVNPDFNPFKKDYWGFYKSDYNKGSTANYTTSSSANSIEAWSLVKISLPTGSDYLIEYEADEYERVGSKGDNAILGFPQQISRFKSGTISVDKTSAPPAVVGIPYPTQYTKFRFRDVILDDYDVINQSNSNIRSLEVYANYGGSSSCEGNGGSVSEQYPTVDETDYWIDENGYFEFDVNQNARIWGNDCYPSLIGENNYIKVTLKKAYGGGLRVKSLKLIDPVTGVFIKNQFDYSEGISTVDLDKFETENKILVVNSSDPHTKSPNVGYSKVKVSNIGMNGNSNGYVEYSFNNYSEPYSVSMFDKTEILFNGHLVNVDEVIILTEMLGDYGQPSEVLKYDSNDNIVSRNIYNYKTFNTIEEAFHRKLRLTDAFPDTPPMEKNTIFIKKQHKTVLSSTESYQDGAMISTSFKDFDPVTGEALTQTIEDETSIVKTKTIESVPAYHLYPQMGPKSLNESNENLLIPKAKKSLKFGTKILGADKTTWTNSVSTRTYDAQTGLYQTSSITGFFLPEISKVYNGEDNDANWLFDSEVTLYSKNLLPLEIRSKNNMFSANKLGYNDQYVIAEISNANYLSFAYTGFESVLELEDGSCFEGEVMSQSNNAEASQILETTSIKAHTGKFMLEVNSGETGAYFKSFSKQETKEGENYESGFITGTTYVAYGWVHKDYKEGAQIKVNLTGISTTLGTVNSSSIGTPNDNNVLIVGDWIRISTQILVPSDLENGGEINFQLLNAGSGTCYFDDFRVQPIDASMNCYVLDEKTGDLLYEFDKNHLFVKYEYDYSGRVKTTYVETELGIKKVKEVNYNNSKLN